MRIPIGISLKAKAFLQKRFPTPPTKAIEILSAAMKSHNLKQNSFELEPDFRLPDHDATKPMLIIYWQLRMVEKDRPVKKVIQLWRAVQGIESLRDFRQELPKPDKLEQRTNFRLNGRLYENYICLTDE